MIKWSEILYVHSGIILKTMELLIKANKLKDNKMKYRIYRKAWRLNHKKVDEIFHWWDHV